MAKAERGGTYRHKKTGEVGVVHSVVRGIARITFRSGRTAYVHTSSLHKPGGCLSVFLMFVTTVMGAGYAWYSTAA